MILLYHSIKFNRRCSLIILQFAILHSKLCIKQRKPFKGIQTQASPSLFRVDYWSTGLLIWMHGGCLIALFRQLIAALANCRMDSSSIEQKGSFIFTERASRFLLFAERKIFTFNLLSIHIMSNNYHHPEVKFISLSEFKNVLHSASSGMLHRVSRSHQ